MIDLPLRIAFWALVLFAASRIGAWITGSRLRGLAHLAWDGAAGLPLLVAVILAAGLLPGGFRPVVPPVLVACAVLVAVVRAWSDPVQRFPGRGRASGATIGAVALLGLVALAGLAWNQVPPLFFDSLAYHFAQPDLWLVNGRIAPEPWSLHSWFPPGMSVLYGVGLALGSHAWANDANLLLGLIILVLAFDVGHRLWGAGAGLAAALLLAAFPIFLHALAVPAADLGHGAFSAATLAALLLARDEVREVWARRASWLCAGAVLTKYTGLLVPLALGVAWVAVSASRQGNSLRLSAGLRAAVLFALPALVLIGPWLASNAAVVGNPVAPALSGVLPPEGLAPRGAEYFRADARGGLPGLADLERLIPRLFTGDEGESGFYPTPAWGWMPLLLPLGLALFHRDLRLRSILALAGGLLLLWFLTYRWERFLVAVTFLIAIALAGVLTLAWRRGSALRLLPVAAALLGAGALIQSCSGIVRFTGALPVVLGYEDGRAFLERSWPTSALYRAAGETLEPGSTRVLLVGEMRHYGLALSRAAPTGFNRHPLVETLETGGDPASTRRRLRELGFTHLIVDQARVERSAQRYPSLAAVHERPQAYREFLGSLDRPLATSGSAVLYAIPD